MQKHLHILQLLQKQLLRQHMQKQLLQAPPAATAKSTTTTDKTTTAAKATQKSEAPAKMVKETLPAGVYPDTKG